jgi:hypothetical protein
MEGWIYFLHFRNFQQSFYRNLSCQKDISPDSQGEMSPDLTRYRLKNRSTLLYGKKGGGEHIFSLDGYSVIKAQIISKHTQ